MTAISFTADRPPGLFPLFLVFGQLSAATPFPGEWKSECRGAGGVPRQTEESAILNASFPGGALLYKERQRFLFAPDRAAFEAGSLSIDVKADGIRSPLKAWIFVNGKCYGKIDCNREESVLIPPGRVDILVENQGRINAGMGRAEHWNKGITGALISSRRLYHWTIYPLPLKDLSSLRFTSGLPESTGPRFYRAEFTLDTPADTYIRIPFGTHGQLFLNGFNLGRYRVQGPQFALYAPAGLLKTGKNELIAFELEGLREPRIDFLDHPDHTPVLEMVR